MKKNVMMRVAAMLLVCVLASTCGISGTFAKYVTQASGTDSARVAKWGVQVSGMGDGLFVTTYAKDSATDIANTVQASVDVVAPGTNNTGYAMFSLTGTPEVAVNVQLVITGAAGAANATDVVLAEGQYWDWTQAPYTTKFDAAEYHPLTFTLKDGATELKTGTFAEIEAFLEGKTGHYAPGTDLATILGGTTGNYTLTWNWEFESGHDKEDTLLGNIAAGLDTASAGTSISLEFAISIIVTQVD